MNKLLTKLKGKLRTKKELEKWTFRSKHPMKNYVYLTSTLKKRDRQTDIRTNLGLN